MTGPASRPARIAAGLIAAAALAAAALAPPALAQGTVSMAVEPDGSARAALVVTSDSPATLSATTPPPITVEFDPAFGGPGEWRTEMTVRANDAADADYEFPVTIDSEGGAIAVVTVALRVGAGGPAPAVLEEPGAGTGPSWRPLAIAGVILAGVAMVVGALAYWQARPHVGRVVIPERPVRAVPRARRNEPTTASRPAPRPTEGSRPRGR